MRTKWMLVVAGGIVAAMAIGGFVGHHMLQLHESREIKKWLRETRAKWRASPKWQRSQDWIQRTQDLHDQLPLVRHFDDWLRLRREIRERWHDSTNISRRIWALPPPRLPLKEWAQYYRLTYVAGLSDSGLRTVFEP